MSVTVEASARSSEALRREIADIDLDLVALDGKSSSQDAKIASLALLVRRGDSTAAGRVSQCRELKVKVSDDMSLLRQARAAAEVELKEAIEREAQAARQAISDEARKFADDLEPLGAVLDEALADLKSTYLNLKRKLSAAQLGGYGPNGNIVGTLLSEALRGALWNIPELKIESPHTRIHRTCSSLTIAWAAGARGGAARLLLPPGQSLPRPNGHRPPAAEILASAVHYSPDGRKVPKVEDIGELFENDFKNFTVKDPRG